jgi:hypothetical protein
MPDDWGKMEEQVENELRSIPKFWHEATTRIPLAVGRDYEGGWTIDPAFLREIEVKTRDTEHIYEEAIEEVLLVVFGLTRNPIATANNAEAES